MPAIHRPPDSGISLPGRKGRIGSGGALGSFAAQSGGGAGARLPRPRRDCRRGCADSGPGRAAASARSCWPAGGAPLASHGRQAGRAPPADSRRGRTALPLPLLPLSGDARRGHSRSCCNGDRQPRQSRACRKSRPLLRPRRIGGGPSAAGGPHGAPERLFGHLRRPRHGKDHYRGAHPRSYAGTARRRPDAHRHGRPYRQGRCTPRLVDSIAPGVVALLRSGEAPPARPGHHHPPAARHHPQFDRVPP